MITYILIAVSSVVAVLVDIYIYRRVILGYRLGRIWRIAYILYAFMADTMVVTALIKHRGAADADSARMLHAAMWTVTIFFLNCIPKTIYVLVSLGDIVREKMKGVRSRIFGYVGVILALIVAGQMVYAMTFGRGRIRVEQVELYFDNLPASFDGLRVVEFSDPHLGSLVNPDKFLNRLARTMSSLEPDIVIHGGDLINTHSRELNDQTMAMLRKIEVPRYGLYSVLGNHDMGVYVTDTIKHPFATTISSVISHQMQLGWQVLLDEWVYVSNGVDSIAISGLNYPYDPSLRSSHTQKLTGVNMEQAFRGLPEDVFTITISHAPQLWDEIRQKSATDLTLSGHVHAMQMKFGWGRWVWSPAQFIYPRWSGLYEESGRYLYINDGLGCVMFNMRVGAKPEVTLFVLRSGKK